MIDGVINITPAPAVSRSFRYTYVSRYFARPTAETTDVNDKAAFDVDTDESRLSEELLTLDLVWRWKKAKQLDYAEDLADFERQKEMDIAADGRRNRWPPRACSMRPTAGGRERLRRCGRRSGIGSC